MKVCAYQNCEKPVKAADLCGMHYQRLRKGAPMDVPEGWRPARGPYRNSKSATTTFEERQAARNAEPPLCKCGCGLVMPFNSRKNTYRSYAVGHYRKNALYKDAEWLRSEYVDKGRTVDDIAASCGVRGSSVRHFMSQFGIQARTQSESLMLSGAVSGANNPSWKGGVTPERQKLYKTKEWKALVLSVWTRDNFKCVRCGHGQDHGEHALHAHHVATWASAPHLRTDIDNIVTLCHSCHLWVHSNANECGEYLAA